MGAFTKAPVDSTPSWFTLNDLVDPLFINIISLSTDSGIILKIASKLFEFEPTLNSKKLPDPFIKKFPLPDTSFLSRSSIPPN